MRTNKDKDAIRCERIRVEAKLTFACMILGRLDIEHKVACLSEVPLVLSLLRFFDNHRRSNCQTLNARMMGTDLFAADYHTTLHRLSVGFHWDTEGHEAKVSRSHPHSYTAGETMHHNEFAHAAIESHAAGTTSRNLETSRGKVYCRSESLSVGSDETSDENFSYMCCQRYRQTVASRDEFFRVELTLTLVENISCKANT